MEPKVFYSTDPSNALPIQYGKEFPANLPAKTVLETLKDTVNRFPNRVSHRFNDSGEMKEITWIQYYNDVIQFAKGCVNVGAHPHSGVAIQG